jgi:hypothetical protein
MSLKLMVYPVTFKEALEMLSKELLQKDIAAAAILSDDARYTAGRQAFTLIIYIDTSKFSGVTDDIKRVVVKAILAHEICHFAFYYELFLTLGGDNTQMV